MKFCLLTITGMDRPVEAADFVFFARSSRPTCQDPERRFSLLADDIALLNPNTRTCPIFRTRRDAEITKAIYRRVPVLVNENREDGNPWGITFMTHVPHDQRFRSLPHARRARSRRLGA